MAKAKLLILIFLSILFSKETMAEPYDLNFRSNSKVTTSRGAWIYTLRTLDSGEVVLHPTLKLAKDHKLTFRPSVFFQGQKYRYKKDDGSYGFKKVRSRFFGSILISTQGVSGSLLAEIQRLNRERIFVYEWHVDKTDYILRAYNEAPPKDALFPSQSFRWDRVNPAKAWTAYASNFILQNKDTFFDMEISDIEEFCPGYNRPGKTEMDKVAFWVHLLNSISWRESKFDPGVFNDESDFGDGSLKVISRGLLQTSFDSLRGYRRWGIGCDQISEAGQIHNPRPSIECALTIMKRWIHGDGCISCKQGSEYQGSARYWSPLKFPHRVATTLNSRGYANIGYRDEIVEETSSKAACQ